MDAFDVAIVGYGPTGMVLAALLGEQGHDVVVLERYPSLYNAPRAGGFDDEVMRTFQKLGLAEAIGSETFAQDTYEWVNANGEMLVEITYDNPARGGWPAFNAFYQPHLESVLDSRCKALKTVDVRQGLCADGLDVSASGGTVECVTADGRRQRVAARFIVGCDGGGSFVREAIGGGFDSYGFEENWLVCDFRINAEQDSLPKLRQVCDPIQPSSIVRLGHRHHRFSFALNRDDKREEVTDARAVWKRVAGYLSPADADLVRAANYVFRSRVAKRWRSGPVILAGDAAHEMPPFLGQGMCSGIRDAHNLAWKLDLVLRGHASPEILDSYQAEREPHVRAITEKAIELGHVQTMRDPVAAHARDEHLLALRRADQAPEKFVVPGLSAGLIASDRPHAGAVFPQGLVQVVAPPATTLFDSAVGAGPMIVRRVAGIGLDLPAEVRWSELSGSIATICLEDEQDEIEADGDAAEVRLVDVGGSYREWFARHPCQAALVRPDWYVYGTADDSAGLSSLVDRFVAELETHHEAWSRRCQTHGS